MNEDGTITCAACGTTATGHPYEKGGGHSFPPGWTFVHSAKGGAPDLCPSCGFMAGSLVDAFIEATQEAARRKKAGML